MFELPSAPDVSSEDAPCGSRSHDTGKFKLGHGGRRTGAGRPRKIIASVAQESWTGPRWIVYRTFPQAETSCAIELARQGYLAYAPQIADRRRDPVIKTVWHRVLVPRFPGYGFAKLGPTDPWLPLKETSGISAVLLIGGKPAPVPIGEVEKHMADDEELCDLAREEMPEFGPGTRVRIEAGAFAGQPGTVLSCNGLVTMINVEVFGREAPCRIARSMVVEA